MKPTEYYKYLSDLIEDLTEHQIDNIIDDKEETKYLLRTLLYERYNYMSEDELDETCDLLKFRPIIEEE